MRVFVGIPEFKWFFPIGDELAVLRGEGLPSSDPSIVVRARIRSSPLLSSRAAIHALLLLIQ